LRKNTFSRTKKKVVFLSDQDEKRVEVSFDGSFTRGFEGTEFIVSLPIIKGINQAALKDYLPKRGKDVSSDSSSSGDKPRSNFGGEKALQRGLGLSDS
jgi:hypothetical protein